MILDPSVPSRSAIRNEIKQQWSRRHKTGELRYRYYNKKRLDLTSQFENLTLPHSKGQGKRKVRTNFHSTIGEKGKNSEGDTTAYWGTRIGC